MQNWYCLIHFPDGTESIHLVPGPAPVPHRDDRETVIKIDGKPGLWLVNEITTRVQRYEYAAEIWVRPREPDARISSPPVT